MKHWESIPVWPEWVERDGTPYVHQSWETRYESHYWRIEVWYVGVVDGRCCDITLECVTVMEPMRVGIPNSIARGNVHDDDGYQWWNKIVSEIPRIDDHEGIAALILDLKTRLPVHATLMVL